MTQCMLTVGLADIKLNEMRAIDFCLLEHVTIIPLLEHSRVSSCHHYSPWLLPLEHSPLIINTLIYFKLLQNSYFFYKSCTDQPI